MDNIFPLMVEAINGDVLEFTQVKYFRCSKLIPAGPVVIRYFNDDVCSVAKKMFSMSYEGEVFSTTQFKTMNDFWYYYNSKCGSNRIYLLINGCHMILNGKKVSI